MGDYKPLLVLALVLAILQRVLAYPYTRWRTSALNRANGCLPARKIPSRDPLLGLDVVFRLRKAINERRLLPLLPRIFEAAGSWTLEANLAGKRVLWIADPDNLKAVLATQARDWTIGASRRETITPIFGPNILIAEGELWHETRNVMRPAFARRQFGALEMLDFHARRLVERLPRDGKTEVDLGPLFFKLSMDVATEFLFGFSTNNLAATNDAEGDAFAEALDSLQNDMVAGQYLGKLGALFLPNRRVRDAKRVAFGTIDGYIESTKKMLSAEAGDNKAEARYNVLQEMMRSWPAQNGRVRGEATALLLGGRDTTAATLTNLYYYLARSPEIWAKLRGECLAGPEKPTFEELKGLKYLGNCVSESLRIVNPTIDLSRTATTDTILPCGGGPDGKSPLFVQKGTNVQLWIYAVHHRKDVWGADADEFRPERWDEYRTTTWAYGPFGGGPRVCIGQQLALTEAMHTTFRLARAFKAVESTDSRPWTESLAVGTTTAHGVRVKLVPA